MESDSPAGATSNCIMSEMKYYRRVQYTLALMRAKNRRIIFCSLLDIRENVLLDIRENVEWPHFFGPPCMYVNTNRPPVILLHLYCTAALSRVIKNDDDDEYSDHTETAV